MNRADFLAELARSLSGVPGDERREILADYEEHFRMGLADGKTEEEISASLGQPAAIARAYRADYLVEQASTAKSAGNILRAVLAVVSLSFFNLVVVLGPFLGLVGTLVGLWAAGVGVTLGGVAVLLAALVSPFIRLLPPVAATGALGAALIGLGLTSLGTLSCIGLYFLTTWFYKLTVRYLKFNLRVITG